MIMMMMMIPCTPDNVRERDKAKSKLNEMWTYMKKRSRRFEEKEAHIRVSHMNAEV